MRAVVVAKSPSVEGLRVLVRFLPALGGRVEERFVFPLGTTRAQAVAQVRARGSELRAALEDTGPAVAVGEELPVG